MKDTLYLTTRLGNITEEYMPNTEEGQAIRNARIEMILWCTNAGRLRTKKEVENYISNMHIKDWVTDEFGYCIRPELPALNGCVIGEGILPLRELMSELKKDGFDGECVMELNTVEITKKDVEKSVEFMKKYLIIKELSI